MEHLQEQLAKIEQDLSAEKQKGPEGDQTIIARLESEQAHILEQIMLANQAKEQQEREVHTQEVNESNSDIAVAVFDALIPDPKLFESMMGLMEFSDWRSGFYQLFDAALADRTKLMDEKHVEELAQKDEKIRMLGRQGLEIQRQLDEANSALSQNDVTFSELKNKVEGLEQINADYDHLNDQLHRRIDNKDDEIAQLNKSVVSLTQENEDLKARLKAAQETREESKPSQSFTERMHEIKSKNEARIKSAAELAAEGQLGFRGKVTLPEIRQQESQFRDFPAIESNGNQLPSAQVDETVKQEATFPSAPNFEAPEPVGAVGTGTTGDAQGNPIDRELPAKEVSREEHEALKSRVEALERKAA